MFIFRSKTAIQVCVITMTRGKDIIYDVRETTVSLHVRLAGKCHKTVSKLSRVQHFTVRKIICKCKAFMTVASLTDVQADLT